MRRFVSFRAFYPCYLSEHRHSLSSFAGDWFMFKEMLFGCIRW
ncbi:MULTISPECIES: hypothetical protein [Xanthomonas translucens group]|nr:hypothetical protein [Xanthomonas translucens]